MSNPSPAEHVQQLIQQQSSLLATKALLSEQLETTNKALIELRAALRGIEIGRDLAKQEADRDTEANAASTEGE
ncbi:hypothetical protein D3C72_1765750 [compost metagenome]